MSGQPYVYATDPARFRAEYMDQLNQRAILDDTVLQAVKNYVNTGTIPPISQVPDTRTTAEKLLDIEKLKLSIVKDLEPVMSPNVAMSLVQGLSQSPLNTDNKLIIFFAQTGKAIIDKLKDQYRFGIKGDANDIATFVEFINNAYMKKQQGANSVKQFLDSTNSGRDVYTKNDIELLKNNLVGIVAELPIVSSQINVNGPIVHELRGAIENIAARLQLLSSLLPNEKGYNRLIDTIYSDEGYEGDDDSEIAMEALTILKTRFPKKGFLETIYNQMKKFIDSKNFKEAVTTTVKLNELLPDDNDMQLLSNPVLDRIFNSPSNTEIIDRQRNARGQVPAGRYEAAEGRGIAKRKGRPRGSGILIPIEDKIEPNRGIDPSYKYIKFGNYLISNPKLSDGIISLKTKKGSNVVGFPNYKASDHMTKIIKTIIGGSLPDFESMSKLSEDEKAYLYKVSKKANILEKLNIPTPSKDKEEKDYHQFEVMKGEIMSGNDSKELIKNFKVLLLKLSKSGKLPRNQVDEIFYDLLQLGY